MTEFYRHKAMADGHLNKCKTCTKADVGLYRAANIDAVRAYDRERAKTEARKVKNLLVSSKWRAENPNRRAAQAALDNAVRGGRIIPWPVCELPECNSKPEAHHPDYDRPLQVVWLCSAHHKQAHALFKKINSVKEFPLEVQHDRP